MPQLPATPSPSKKSSSDARSKATSSFTKAGQILDTWRIHIDLNKAKPECLEDLVHHLQDKRGIDVTPKSKFLQNNAELVMKKRNEDMAVHLLADQITYMEQLSPAHDDGEPLIQRGRSDQWYDRVPRPVDADGKLAAALEQAMEAEGSPPRPKPDMSFGFANHAFNDIQLARIKTLPKEYHLYSDAPWFPYQVMEWKSHQRSPVGAEQQAQRDATAAGDTLYRLLKLAYPYEEPSPASTCIFSLCVHSSGFDFRVHWRCVANDGKVSWEGDRVVDARWHKPDEVFEARGAIMKTLDWARSTRLTDIRDALEVIQFSRPR
ncbi:MAG: hypothetical protein Q9186_006742, partial [Xanthomendoza sp. 1 TL-2023]